jgi:hypothetical protein
MNLTNSFIPPNNGNLLSKGLPGYVGTPIGQPLYMNSLMGAGSFGSSPPPGYGNTLPAQNYGNTPAYGTPALGFPYPPQASGPSKRTYLQQFAEQNGTNHVASDKYNGNAFISQFGDNAYRQSFAMNQGTGNLYLQQLGGAYGNNTSQIGSFNGDFKHFGYNNQGGNQIDYSNLYGKNNISTFANGNSFNQVNLNNVQNGVRYLTSGNTNLNVENSPNASVLISGDDDQSSSYYVRIANSYGAKKNSIIMNMDGTDRATVDLSAARNNSEIFLNGSGRSATINTKNGMKDTLYIDEGTLVDYSNMDNFDTVIVKSSTGGLRTFQAGESKGKDFISPLLQGAGMSTGANPGAVQMNVQGLFGNTYSNLPMGRVISTAQGSPQGNVQTPYVAPNYGQAPQPYALAPMPLQQNAYYSPLQPTNEQSSLLDANTTIEMLMGMMQNYLSMTLDPNSNDYDGPLGTFTSNVNDGLNYRENVYNF